MRTSLPDGRGDDEIGEFKETGWDRVQGPTAWGVSRVSTGITSSGACRYQVISRDLCSSEMKCKEREIEAGDAQPGEAVSPSAEESNGRPDCLGEFILGEKD